ncbi:MAG: DNA polymerase III subunit gamma/tau [Pseudomonadota bacterium]
MADERDNPAAATGSPPGSAEAPSAYRVLARKYRPRTFAEMIGQEAMVRTLSNAIAQGRLAHAFILTGVRGVGKTTTARILARAFNCIGPDGTGGPTVEPCGLCEHCRAIAEDRHVDVMEMDAASRTGVADIRELIEGVRYAPVQARYKIYIIDEVHMLSTAAFNALLKTLEEPPPHVKFIFATTEIRKVPVTVLSRCQRFDLRRVDAETLAAHFGRVAEAEGAKIAPAALALIARAADGSVRDGLSLLDQAIARREGEGEIGEAEVRDMLGLADRTQLFDLFERAMKGEGAGTLALLAEMYRAGADPVVTLQDLLGLVHWLTRVKLVPETADDPALPEAERTRGKAMAEALAIPVLARAWQMLLKGLSETQAAPSPLQAAEMALIRLMHAASLPTPGELVRRIEEQGGVPAAGSGVPSRGGASGTGTRGSGNGNSASAVGAQVSAGATGGAPAGPTAALAVGAEGVYAEPGSARAAPLRVPAPQSFEGLAALVAEKREGVLHAHLVNDVHLVRFEPGRLEIHPAAGAPGNLANRLGTLLSEWTGQRWVVAVSAEPGQPTLRQQAEALRQRQHREAAAHPLVQAVMKHFPGASIEAIRELKPEAAEAPAAAGTADENGGADPGEDEPAAD